MNYRLIKPLMVVFAVACVASAASAQPAVSPVQGKLVIPDAKVLPGVPFDMWVELRNASDGSVGVGLCPRLLVRTAKGTAFEVGHAHGGPYLVMAPGETKTLPYPIGSELGAYFFSDSRLSPPGQYTISMRMDYCFGHGVPQQDLLPPTFLGPVVTNEVTVERLQPAGSDAAVWQEILDTSKGNWPPSIFPVSQEDSRRHRSLPGLTCHRTASLRGVAV